MWIWAACFVLVKRYGPSKVRSTVYRYGAPPCMAAIASLLEEDQKQEMWQTYVADMSCRMVHAWSKKCKIPYYSEIVGKAKPARKDSRTGQEIVDNIIKKRRMKQRRREVARNNEAI